MKYFSFCKTLLVVGLVNMSLTLISQNEVNPEQNHGRKAVPEPAIQPFVLPGSNTDAPAGSISVAENTTYNNYTAQELVQNLLVTGCLTASNVRFGYYKKNNNVWTWTNHTWSATPGDRQMAYFNKATSTFPLDEGIVLTTGKASSAMGPNSSGNKSDKMVSAASDPDLASITGKTMFDASILEFDFVPAGNTIEFTYIFTSEEYIEYCETEFNDAFGFFLSGPGISGSYTNNAVNLATILNNIPVTINDIHPAGTNVNNVNFSAENATYYLDNPSGSVTMQFDGSTIVLTATYTVMPCSTYKIKMSVADASDQVWDAGVFLGARSFNSENINLTNFGNLIEDQNHVFEGCNNFFRVARTNPDLSQPLTVNLILSGTTTNGTDIQTTGGQPFPSTVVIPASASYIDIPYIAPADAVSDNDETLIVQVMTSCPCAATQIYVTRTINIYEHAVISSVSAINAQCNGQNNGAITVNAIGGSGNYLYSINNGTSWQSVNNFTGLSAGNYTVLLKDPGSCLANSSYAATIGNPTPIVANAGPDATICSGEETQLNGSGGVQYSWSPATGLNYTNIANPIASPSATTTYTLTVTNAAGQCTSTDNIVVTVNPGPVAPTSISVNRSILCADDSGNITLTATGGSGTTLRWFTGSCGGTSIGTGNNLVIPSPTATTTYYAWWENSCNHSSCAQLTVTVPLAISISASAGTISCNGGTTTLTATASGGTGSLQYSLNGGTYQSGNTFTVNSAGSPYVVTVKDANNCLATSNSVSVTQPAAISFGSSQVTNVSCLGGSNGTITVSASGGTGSIVYSISPNIGSQSPAGKFINLTAQAYTITATDANGCTANTSVTVGTQADLTAPQITVCAPAQSAFANASCQAAVPNFTANVTATDNCTASNALVITQSPAEGTPVSTGVTTVTITVTDAAGNSATCNTSFTVTDNTNPVIVTCAPAQSANANASCQAAVPNFTANVTATDNCTSAANLTITQSPAAGTPVTTGVTTVTITVTDAAGNSATCNTSFTVTDNTNPTIVTCAPAQSAFANASCQAAVPNFTANVTATDNCTASNALVITQSPTAGTLVSTGVTSVTITVTDGAGNSATCNTSFTVTDNTNPVIVTCAPNQSAFANASCQAAVPNFTANVTATDNCTVSNALVITQSPTAGTLVSTGVTSVTITVTDAAGNSATCYTSFTVTDNTNPVIVTCAPAQSAFANASCQAAVPNFTVNVTATDNCTASNALVITQSPAEGTPVSTGVTTVTITVTDAAGNSATCNTSFTVTDNTDPVIVTCAPAQSAFANASCQAAVPNFTVNVTATDNCTASNALVITQSPAEGTPVSTGVTTVTITVTDAAGNSATCNTSFTVTDNTDPVIVTCAPAQSAFANASCQASVPNFTANVTATDNCTSAANLTITQSPAEGTPVSTGVTTVTITVTDAAGNSATCNTSFTVTDNTIPVIVTCAPAQSAFANASCQAAVPDFTANVTATDNCTVAANLTITQSPTAGTLVSTGVTSVTITVTDGAGNSATCNTSFTVTDNTDPVIVTCAPSQSAFANASCQASVPNFTANVTATDNCTSAANLTITQSPAAGTLVSTGVTSVTITVTDGAGNSATCNTSFTVTDNTNPVIVTCAPAQSAFANASCQAAVPNFTANVTATDNCTASNALVITQSPTTGTLVSTGVTSVTITVTDAAGNSATCNTSFTVTDNTNPTIVTCAPAQSAFANASCQASVPDFTGNVTATDNCTSVANLTITQSPAAGTPVTTGVTTVTITVTDAAGNSATCNTSFTVTDNTDPVIVTCAPAQSAFANASCQASVPDFTANVTATDNCTSAANLTITQSPAAGTLVSTGVTSVTITVTDGAGNSATCNTSFTVTDNTNPVIVTCAPAQSAFANASCQAAVPNFTANVTATDNCTASNALVITQSPTAGTLVSTGVTSVTITVTDGAGNSATCNTSFTVNDNTNPVIVTCAPAQSAFANVSCQAAVPNFTVNVTATDNCTSAANLTITQSPTAGTLVSTGVTSVTITVTDGAGNSATCNTSFTVTDNTNPVIVTCAPAQSAFANASCQASVPNFTANVTATDNCTASNALVITQSPIAGTLVSTGVTSVTITVTDAAGNSATCNTSFTVTDNTDPVIVTCAPAQSAFANASCQAAVPDFTANVTATDNCTASNALMITQSPTAGTLVSTGVTSVTITVTDGAGNSATCNTSFTVTDNTNPVIVTCAPTQSAFANASCQAAVPNFTANVTATDNCTSAANLTITQSPVAGTLVSTGVTSVTITATDAAGNSATCNTSFTVTDNTNPVIVTCAPAQSAFANASCQAVVPDFTANVTATDNCTSVANLTITQSPTAGTLVSTGVTSVTITVTDGAGNSATCNTSFTVTDNTNPVIVTCAPSQSAFANASCQAAVPDFTANVTAKDNCTSAANLTTTQSPAEGTPVSTGVTTVTITVTDAAGNSATCNTSFTVTDNTNPVIVTCAPAQSAFANASCQAAVPDFTANVTATDNCTATNALVITQSPTAGTLVSTGVTSVTITVTDGAGNSATCNTSFTVTDNTNPVIVTCAPAQSAFANASCQAAVPDFTANVTATDNCTASNALVITQSPTAGTLVSTGVTSVTITVTDAAGNSATCNTSFTVTDNTDPVIVTCAPAQSAFANASCQADVPNFTANVTATDNCTASNALVITQSPTVGTLVSTGVTSVIITVTDGAGNSATCNTSFTVTDNTNPVIVTCAPAQSAFANASCQAAVPDFTANVTATDNCTATNALVITQSPTAGTLVSTGVTTVTITVTDATGNSATCNTSFTVTDNTNPVIVTCAPAQSAFANASCQASVPNFTANVTATDNCTAAANLTITQSPGAGTPVSTGVTTVTITVTDAAGNSATCNTSFTVTDNTNPVIVTCAPAQSAFANASCQASVPNFTANVTATDNCTSAANLTITQSPAAGTPVTTGVTTVTITVNDAAGNSATCNTSFTVTDNTNPVIVTCAPAQSAFANASCQAAVPDFTANVTATDNCTSAANLTITQSPTAGTLVSTGVTSVTITVTDGAGNSATCNTSFTVTDNTNPTIVTCAPAQSAFANASCQAAVPDFTANVTATDNCTSAANLTITQSPAAGTPVTTGVTTVTITVTDGAGNSATCNTSFTVTDNTNPVIVTCAPVQSAFANASCQAAVPNFTANVTATDNCTASNALVITQSPTAGTLVSTGVTSVTITVADGAGNSATCNTSFTVTDNTDPVIVTCAPAQSAFANASCQAAVPAFTANVTATDNCTSVANLTITQSPAEGTLVSTGVTTVTITVTDAAGNSATCNTSFTVIDNSIPTISGPGNVTVNSDPGLCTASNVNLGTPVTNDNCGIATITNNAGSTFPVGNTTVIWTVTDLSGQTATSSQTITVIDNQPPSITCPPSVTVNTDPGQSYASNVLLGNAITGDNCGVDTVYNNAPTQFPLGTTVVSWTVIDINGLSTTCTQTVTVTDNQFPTINCPPTIQVNCIGEVPAVYPDYAAFVLAGGSASDNDGINTGSFTLVSETSDGQSCPETISRVYKIADLNNNFSSCTQLVIVDDQVVPVITVPANVTVECSAVPAVGTATATDNCDTEVTVTYEGETRTNGACADSYTLTRTWKATDNCENFATGSQVITVQDNTIPVITVPENVTVECSAVPAVGTATATDNCDTEVTVTYEGETRTNGTCTDSYTLTRTWKATDNCGNFATGSQVITVQDNTVPVITVPANVTVECSAVPAVGTATATDNCDSDVTVTYEGETRTNGTCADSYTLTRTWKATDNCGNFATGSQVLTVQDNTIPVITVPENVTAECSAVPAVGTATATDNCDTDVTVTYEGETRTNGTCTDSYTLTRTWKATDNCGNFATGSQVITVQDNTIPVITVPANVTVECSAVPAVGTATATDNCDSDVTVTYEGESRTNGSCSDSYTLTRTWKATDNCGNFATGSQVITVQDNTIPVITVPANVTVECSAVPAVGNATATDNCDSDVTVTYEGESRTNGSCSDSYTLTRTWKATDNCGNFATGSQVITVQDNTIPVITVPANVTVECSAVPAVGTATATDNCDSNVTVTYEGESRMNGTCADSYTLTRTWKATDNCGNFATGSQVITVQDNTIPVMTVPANVTVECSAVPAVGNATATDNCDSDVTVTYEGETRTNGTCADSYTLTRTWKATDNCGNFATGSQVITVQDNTIPVITVPANVTVECSVVPAVGTATATDNCDTEVTVTYEGETRTNGTCADSYTLTRTWKATDNCGNFATGSQEITVQDNTIPVITVPENVTVECSAVPAVGTATATDNCDTDVTVTYEGESRTNGTCADSYTLTRTWKATDNCGNFATGSQEITVQDNTIPVITVPANVTVECSAVPAVGTATATDHCDTDVTVTYEGESRTNVTCADSYTLTRTWKATDNCGNFATGSQVITVQDNTIPVITVPANVTVECSAVPAVGTATATDNCDTDVTVTYEGESRTNGTCADAYTLTRTWKATDNCGNFATGSQEISVQDNTIPVITVPENVTVECSAVPAVGTATAADNCDSDVTVTYEGESRTNGTCSDSYTLTRTWKATDNCGNFATGSQVITVQDNTIPVITVPANVTVECSAVPAVGNATATDNCDSDVTVTYEGESRTNGTCADSYTLTRTWKATDNCGNFATGSQEISVQDNTIPVITVPENVTVECSAVPAVGTATAADNCDSDVTVTYEGESRTNGTCADSYTLTRTWKATDNCGNFATGSQVITVQDNIVPVITVPANVTVECSAVPTVGNATATDNCDSDVTVTYEGETRTNGTCTDSYTLTRTWKATDNCGNFATGSQEISVQDNTIPVITVPENVTVECSAVPAVGTATAADNCDSDVTVTYEGESRTNGTCADSYTLTRTWKATDNCGNFATGSQVITVQDNIVPVITVPANVTVECSAVPTVGNATATDNCDSDVTVTYEGETRTNGTCTDSYTLTRTWKATDNCGNFATGSQVITVQDNTIPVITVPENVTAECSAVPAVGTATATDNCDSDVTVTYEGETRTNGSCADSYTLTRTWKATDNCGNFATGSQVITVQDNTIPVITVPENVTVECSAVPAIGTATATDNCDSDVTVTYEGESRTNGSCSDSYTLTRTWKAIDNCGNFATGSQVITVQDNTIPVITVPENVTVECSAVPAVGTATATDNCDSDVTVTYEGETRTNGTCADSYTLTRTWKATDNCGNFATGSQVITVQDNTIPVITVPENVTVECSAVPAVGTATATDNCDSDVTVTYEGETRTNGTCADSYTLTRTWKATDNCGNFATGSQVITVQDNTIPVITVPANVTVECSAVPAVGNATATDNCDTEVTVTYEGESRTNGTCTDSYTLTRTWKATDNCGNFATGSQVITVQDNTIPVITVPANVTVECSAVPAVGTATATDNCDTEVTVTYEGESRTNGTCADSYTLTRTWKATDNCGNFATGSQVITVQDNTIPVITVPENVTVECSAVPAVGTATAADNCDSDVTLTYEGESRTNGTCADSYTLTRTWKATDNCGNFATGSQVITVQDNTIPEITVPANVTVECSAVPAVGNATATDNCDTEVTVTYEGESRTNGTCTDSYTLTRTWKAIDNCGNFATGSQVLTVQDNTIPVITVPENVTVECSAVPAVGIATATDNCDSDVTVTYEGESRTNGTCADSYTLTRTWKATDNCGNFATGSQVITVQDNTIPVITVPENVTVECSAVPAVGAATATDNCDTEVSVTYEGETRTNGTCADSYTLTRTWKATDNCGNFATGSQVITVQDNTIPVMTVPANVTVECSAVPAVGTATATDNCDSDVTVTYEGETRTNGTCADSYTLTRTWKATDNCGNFATGSQVITVQDNTIPVITVPANVTVECSAVPAIGTATATDNCDTEVTVTYEGETRTNGTCADSYTLTRTWKATDNCGNFATGSQVITVQDNTVPVITVPANVTVECSAVPAVGTATATDNCDSDVTVTYEGESRTNGTCADSYTLTRTWKATDNCGNFATGSQVITVQDNTIPVITVPANVTVECSAVPAVGTATATDNCDTDVTVTYEGESRTNGTCADSYTLTRTWKATDNCGIFATGSQVITVQDNTIPVITVPANVTVECSAVPALGTATATDNCDSDVTVTYEGESRMNGTCADSYTLTRTWKAVDNCGNFTTGSQVITVQDNTIPVITVPANVTVECSAVPAVGTATATDNCDTDVTVTYVGETRTIGTCTDSYTLTRTWKATDNCGNFATGSQVITVQDNTIPVITVPANITVECSAVPAVGTATATDNCDSDVTVTYEGETRTNGSCTDSYTLTRTWKATDKCGNFATGSQVITVQDNTIPVITVPENVTVECSAVPAVGTATATDNCDTDVTVTYEGESRTNGSCTDSYTLTRTWKATDNCGNFATGSQVITVQDNTIPVMTVPANVTVECSAVPAVGTAIATDNCDSDVTVTYEGETRTNGTCADSYTLTRTWKATDNCGNFATGSQIITVQDNTIPVITVPENVTVECSVVPAVGTATATDNCDSDVIVTYEGETRTNGTCADAYTLTRTWKATDNCGNFATGSQVITVQDNTIPVITVPANVTVECSVVPAVGTATATDNCDTEVTVTYEGESRTNGTCADAYTLTRTWKATDNCGNFATGSQVITVQDNTIPVITVPENVTVECSAVPAVGTATATDNCDSDVTVTYDGEFRTNGTCADSYTLTRTWKAIDNCGNFTTGSQLITVQDNTAPVIGILPDPTTINCPALPEFTTPVANDACGGSVNLTSNDVTTAGSCEGSYSVTRTWTATDACNNSSTATQTINVQDVTAPIVICPASITVASDPGICGANVTVPAPQVTEGCSEVTLVNSFNNTGNASGLYPTGTTQVNWTITDACGNTSTCSMSVTITDSQAPVIVCPPDVIACTNETVILGTATATDNCGVANVYYNGPSSFGTGTTIVTWIATDLNGNSSSCQQNVTVVAEVTVYAGPDASICETAESYTLTGASAENYASVIWTANGQGTLSNANTLNPTYTPAPGETGIILFSLTGIGQAPCGNATDQMALTIVPEPAGSAGNDNTICEGAYYQTLSASASNYSSLLWTSSGSGMFNNPGLLNTVYTPSQADIDAGSVQLSLTITGNMPCNPITDFMILHIEKSAQAYAGPDASVCNGSSYTVSAATVTNANTINWTHTGNGILENPGTLKPTYIPANGETGVITLRLEVTGTGNCGNATDEMLLNLAVSPTVNAGSDLSSCGVEVVAINGATASNYSSILWTTNGTGTFSNSNLLNPEYTPSQADVASGSVVLQLKAIGIAPCGDLSDQLTLTFGGYPMVEAGSDGNICEGESFTLTGVNATNYSILNWMISPETAGTISGSSLLNPTFNASPGFNGIVTLTLYAQGISGCADSTVSDFVKLIVNARPIVDAGSDQQIAEGASTQLSGSANSGSGLYAIKWEPAGLLVDSEILNPITKPMQSTSTFTLTVMDLATSCSSSDLMTVEIQGGVNNLIAIADYDTTRVKVPVTINVITNDINPENKQLSVTLCENPEHGIALINDDLTITYTPNFKFYGDDVFCYRICEVGNPSNCSDTLVYIHVVPSGMNDFDFFSGITPNEDEVNDDWIIRGIEDFPENTVIIFNRWGDKIREFEGYDNENNVWDGKNEHGKPVPDGTYFYILEINGLGKVSGWIYVRGNHQE